MMDFKPTRKAVSSGMNLASLSDQYELDTSASNLDKLFHRFVVFIDATPNTIRTYKTSLKQWFIYMKKQGIRNPSPDDVRNYRTYLKEAGKKPTTVQNYIIAVKQFFKWTEAEGLYPNVAKYVKGAKLSRNFKKDYLTSRQAKKVLDGIDRSTLLGKRNYSMLILMLTMGLRTIEVSRANIEDIRTSGDATVLYVQGKGHTEKDAMVRMPSIVEDAIRDYLKARKSSSLTEPLFTSTSNNNKGKRLTTRTIRGTVKRCFIKAGFDSPKLTAHSTRHTTATLSLLNGATLQQTQALLRHKNMQTTEIYAHNIQASKNPASNEVANAIFN
ncbi:tyrosine-type recombinase/integrase [Lactobacillus helveticus]